MTTILAKEPVIAALAAVWASLDDVLAGLDAEAWTTPTPCPGWNVQAVVAHIIGTEAMLDGVKAPELDLEDSPRPHIRNDIGKFNEAWVAEYASRPPAEVLSRYRSLTSSRLDTLKAMEAAEWNAESFTPSGPDTYGRFMSIRVFDCWMHEQDIRDAVGQPGHETGPALDLVFDELTGALGYVVGKKAGAPAGASVTFDLTGATPRTIHVAVDGRAKVVENLPGPATTTLSLPIGTFTRLAGGRVDPATVVDRVEMTGDLVLAQAVLDNLAFTI